MYLHCVDQHLNLPCLHLYPIMHFWELVLWHWLEKGIASNYTDQHLLNSILLIHLMLFAVDFLRIVPLRLLLQCDFSDCPTG